MARYIDATKLEELCDIMADKCDGGTGESIWNQFRTTVEWSPTVELWWIPVTERLPEVNGRYLVTRGLNACGSLWNRVYIANYSDLMGLKSERIWWQGNVGKSDFERLDDVLAWMPLPEPYKERRDDAEIH